MDSREAHTVLGVEPGASEAELLEAYRDRTHVWDADRLGDDDKLRERAAAERKRIQEAFDYLKSGGAAARDHDGEAEAEPVTSPPPGGDASPTGQSAPAPVSPEEYDAVASAVVAELKALWRTRRGKVVAAILLASLIWLVAPRSCGDALFRAGVADGTLYRSRHLALQFRLPGGWAHEPEYDGDRWTNGQERRTSYFADEEGRDLQLHRVFTTRLRGHAELSDREFQKRLRFIGDKLYPPMIPANCKVTELETRRALECRTETITFYASSPYAPGNRTPEYGRMYVVPLSDEILVIAWFAGSAIAESAADIASSITLLEEADEAPPDAVELEAPAGQAELRALCENVEIAPVLEPILRVKRAVLDRHKDGNGTCHLWLERTQGAGTPVLVFVAVLSKAGERLWAQRHESKPIEGEMTHLWVELPSDHDSVAGVYVIPKEKLPKRKR